MGRRSRRTDNRGRPTIETGWPWPKADMSKVETELFELKVETGKPMAKVEIHRVRLIVEIDGQGSVVEIG